MTTHVIIVGGGLSGLAAAWQLHRHGVEFLLVEARERLGGRVLTLPYEGRFFDLGPSWVWDGQPQVAALLNHLGLSTHEQACDGDLLHQSVDGSTQRDPYLKPMQSSLRIQGGAAALTDGLARDLPAGSVRLGTAISAVEAREGAITVRGTSGQGEVRLTANHVALALPLRLAAEFVYQPPLDDASMSLLRATPTWMAGHAKCFAFYDTPFWRDNGLSGSALSRRGPLAEIHDASPAVGGPFALMGFVGIDGPARAVMADGELAQAATAQLRELFGEPAARPRHCHLMDWSDEVFTAAPSDKKAPDHHPRYGVQPRLSAPWRDALHFIGSETALENGGLIEGALQQGCGFAHPVIQRAGISACGWPD